MEEKPVDARVVEQVFAEECARDGVESLGDLRSEFERMAAVEIPKTRKAKLDAKIDQANKALADEDYVLKHRWGLFGYRGVHGRVVEREIIRKCPLCDGAIFVKTIMDTKPTMMVRHNCTSGTASDPSGLLAT